MRFRFAQHGLSFQPAFKGIWTRASLYLFLLVAGLAAGGFCFIKRMMAYPKLFLLYWSVVLLLALALLVTGIVEAVRVRKESQRLLKDLRHRLGSGEGLRKEDRSE